MSDAMSLFDDALPIIADQEAFDYRLLSAEKREFVLQKTDETQILLKRTAENIIQIGKNLQAVNECLSHGQFLPWLHSEFGMGQTTAYRFMQVAERFKDKFTTVVNLIPAKALYLLAAPSTPQEAVNEALQKAEKGEKITHALAQQIIEAKKAQKRAEDAEAQARAEATIAQQALFAAQEESETRIAELTRQLDARKQLDEMQQEIVDLSEPEPQVTEVVKEVVPDAITKQMETLQQQIARLQEERKQQREEANAQEERIKTLDAQLQMATRKGITSENDERIRQGWRLMASEAHSCLMRLLGQWPTPLDVQSFESDDWARVGHLRETLKRVLGECERIRGGYDDLVIDSGPVPYILNGN